MSEESIKAMKKAAEEGPAHMAAQKAHTDAVAANEAARRAGLEVAELPEGVFATKNEAIVYVNQQREAGRYPQRIYDADPNKGDYVWEISSPFHGHGPTVWVTAVSDSKDPAFPEEK